MPDPLDGLDESQLEAVTHAGGPLIVLGGAGTGKTLTLTRRLAWLVAEGVPASGVLALCLSSAAASRMREQADTLLERPYDELRISTPHELCERLLRDEALEAGLDPFFVRAGAADRLALLLDRIDELTLRRHEIRGNPAPLVASFVSRIDRLKAELVTAEDCRRCAEELAAAADGEADRAHAERELELAQVYAAHDGLLAARGALDHGDLVLHGFRLLHEKPHVRRRVAHRFRHLLADDYQDLSFAQGALLRLLWQDHRNVTVAGDDDQAVARVRSAARKNLLDFRREHPEAKVVTLEQGYRCGRRIVEAARATVESCARIPKARGGEGEVRFWRCASERAQAQAVAAEAERLITLSGVAPAEICVLVRSVRDEGPAIRAALAERGIPFRVAGATAYFQRSEVRDVLAWLRLLADPTDSGAVVRALSRAPVELRSVDVARLTQLARRRKLDMVSAVAAACEGPQLSPEGRDRGKAFLKLHRAAAAAFEEMRPDAFVHRLIERIGVRRQQVFAVEADTAERLVNIAKLGELATAYVRREPQATPRDFARYLAAIAESGLPEEEAEPPVPSASIRVTAMAAARGLELDHVFVLGLDADRMPGVPGRAAAEPPDALLKESLPEGGRSAHEARMRRLLYLALTRARTGLVLAWVEAGDGAPARPSPFYEEAREAVGGSEEAFEEELFGPAEGLYSTFRMMRDELLETVSRVGGSVGEMRLDTSLDVSTAVARYLELVKLAALIDRTRQGQSVGEALPEVNELLLQAATPEQRELLLASALDDYLLDMAGDERRRAEALGTGSEPSLEPFIPRRGEGLMLSASDVETYRLCPLKYKFARVFRIPQEPSINQRFGILVHQVLERYHAAGGGPLQDLLGLFDAAWRRSGFGDSNDDLQFRERAVAALKRYWEADRERDGEPVWLERGFSFKLGPHLVRGRVDRVDRLPDGRHELIDYKTGRPKTPEELSEDVQLSLYQMGARESWGLETAAQSYYYVLDNEKVPVEHSAQELERVRGTVAGIAEGILAQEFEPKPSRELCSFCDYRIICPAAER